MTILFKGAGGVENAQNLLNLQIDLENLAGGAGSLTGRTTKALVTAQSSPAIARTNYYTAAGTIAAQDFDLPAAPSEGDIVTIISNAIVTAATFTVTAPGDATVVGAPTALAVDTPVSFQYDVTDNSWIRIG